MESHLHNETIITQQFETNRVEDDFQAKEAISVYHANKNVKRTMTRPKS
jgi:uncharacterized protein YktA (UPF0223 family)